MKNIELKFIFGNPSSAFIIKDLLLVKLILMLFCLLKSFNKSS